MKTIKNKNQKIQEIVSVYKHVTRIQKHNYTEFRVTK